MRLSRAVPTSLTARLVVTAVALVAVVSVLTAALTFARDAHLPHRPARHPGPAVHGPSGERVGAPAARRHAAAPALRRRRGRRRRGRSRGAVRAPGRRPARSSAVYGSFGSAGGVLSSDLVGRTLPASAMSTFEGRAGRRARARGHPADVRVLPRGGREHAAPGPSWPACRPNEIDATVASLVGYESLLLLVGVGIAAGVGTVLVRRQLRPLRSVAETAHDGAHPAAVQRRDRYDGPGARRAHRRAHRGRPGRLGAEHDARARRARPRRAAPQRAAGATVRRRRLPRAAHAADHDPRVRRAEPAHQPARPRSSSRSR